MKPSVERRVREWREALLRDGFSTEHVDELESHLLDAFDDLRLDHAEEVACQLAFAAMGDPRRAEAEALRFPSEVKVAIAFVASCGVSTICLLYTSPSPRDTR